jgi:hypothetical protein
VSPRATTIAQRIAADLEDLRDLERQNSGRQLRRCATSMQTIASTSAGSVSPLGTLPAPEAPIVDPREVSRTRYPIIEWTAERFRYTDWHSGSHAELLARARRIGLIDEAPYRLGWVDRDDATGEAEYTWLAEQMV